MRNEFFITNLITSESYQSAISMKPVNSGCFTPFELLKGETLNGEEPNAIIESVILPGMPEGWKQQLSGISKFLPSAIKGEARELVEAIFVGYNRKNDAQESYLSSVDARIVISELIDTFNFSNLLRTEEERHIATKVALHQFCHSFMTTYEMMGLHVNFMYLRDFFQNIALLLRKMSTLGDIPVNSTDKYFDFKTAYTAAIDGVNKYIYRGQFPGQTRQYTLQNLFGDVQIYVFDFTPIYEASFIIAKILGFMEDMYHEYGSAKCEEQIINERAWQLVDDTLQFLYHEI